MDKLDGKKWLHKEMRKYRSAILFLTCFSVFSTLASLAFAYLTRYLINSASLGNKKGLIIFSCVLLAVLLFRIAMQTLYRFFTDKARARIVRDLRTKMYEEIMRSNYAQVQRYHSGELLNRLTSDLQSVSTTTVSLFPSLVGMVTQCLGAIVALLTTDPWFTLIYVVCGGVFGGIATLFRQEIKKRQKAVLEADGESRAYMQEGVSSLMTVKAYGAEEKSAEKSKHLADVHYNKRLHRSTMSASMHAVFTLLSNFGLIFAIVWCSVSVLYGNTNYGVILSVILLLMQFQHPLTGFSSILPAYYARLASGDRLAEIEAMDKEVFTTFVKADTYNEMLSLGFDNVSFQYEDSPVLKGASFVVEKGKIACLTGVSGSGKSTIFKLLLSIYTPTDGEVFVQSAAEKVTLGIEYRKLFAYVPQGNFLFSGTIRENLTFFQENGDKQDEQYVDMALKTACAEFVYDLPQGLDTQLLEKGAGLSEGQLQRLAIARAILSQRPILLLDEATSALDSETEGKILENIRGLEDKTCLIVTHRPAALSISDKIFVVDEGKILEK